MTALPRSAARPLLKLKRPPGVDETPPPGRPEGKAAKPSKPPKEPPPPLVHPPEWRPAATVPELRAQLAELLTEVPPVFAGPVVPLAAGVVRHAGLPHGARGRRCAAPRSPRQPGRSGRRRAPGGRRLPAEGEPASRRRPAMTGRTEPAEQLASMPTIAEIEFLPDAEGRLLIFVRHAPPDAALDHARLPRPGESVLGVPYEQLVATVAGRIVPDGRGGWRVEAEGAGGQRGERRR